jgi:archaellum component FlaC
MSGGHISHRIKKRHASNHESSSESSVSDDYPLPFSSTEGGSFSRRSKRSIKVSDSESSEADSKASEARETPEKHRVTFTEKDESHSEKRLLSESGYSGMESSSVSEISQEILELRKRIESIEQSFTASRGKSSQGKSKSEESDSSLNGDLDEMMARYAAVTASLRQFDRRLLNGCEQCVAASDVVERLEAEESLVRKTMGELARGSPK